MTYAKPTFPADYDNPSPVDDGTKSVANQLFWATHINRIGDPLKEFSQAVDSNVATEFGFQYGNSVATFSTTTTFTTSARGSLQIFTGSVAVTATLASAATIGVNNLISILNQGSATLTIDTQGSETINAGSTIILTPGQSATLVSDASNWFIIGGNSGLDAGFRTGDTKTTTRDVDTGWLNMDGFTFGDASTGANNESAANEALFKHIYQKFAEVDAAVLEIQANHFAVDSFTNATNTINETAHGLLDGETIAFLIGSGGVIPTGLLPRAVYFIVNKNANDFQVSLTSGGSVVAFSDDGTATINVAKLDKTGSSSANADTDWDAGKTMIMPDARSHVPIGSGAGLDPDTGALLTSRTLGDTGGVEDVTLTAAQLADHEHTLWSATSTGGTDAEIAAGEFSQSDNVPDNDANHRYNIKGDATTPTLGKTGFQEGSTGSSHTNMPPFFIQNVHIKL